MFGRRDLAARLQELGAKIALDSERNVTGADLLMCGDPAAALRLMSEHLII